MSEKSVGIYGNNLSEEDITDSLKVIQKDEKKGREKIEGESEKGPKMLEFIELTNSMLEKEFSDLGVPGYDPIKPEAIHFLPDELYKKTDAGEFVRGAYMGSTNSVIINQDAGIKLFVASTLLHESIHSVSAKSSFLKKDEKMLQGHRLGYSASSVLEEKSYFGMINELVTEALTRELFQKNRALIKEKLNSSDYDFDMLLQYFEEMSQSLSTIVTIVEEKKGYKRGEYWSKLKKGLFTGDMKHLKDIEDVFGRSSVKFLGSLRVKDVNKLGYHETCQLLREFSASKNPEEREEITKKFQITNQDD